MGRGDGAPQGGEADGAPAAFRERELADSGRKNLEKKTGGLGSEEVARRRGKWRSEEARISEAHLGRRKAVSRDDSRGGGWTAVMVTAVWEEHAEVVGTRQERPGAAMVAVWVVW